jgi:hypothetical protein
MKTLVFGAIAAGVALLGLGVAFRHCSKVCGDHRRESCGQSCGCVEAAT